MRRDVMERDMVRRDRERRIRVFVRAAVASLAFTVICGATVAQPYPGKPIRLLIPFPPGAPNDKVARVVGQKLAEQLGVGVVPENRPGAGGNVGLTAAAWLPADGYTLLLSTPA